MIGDELGEKTTDKIVTVGFRASGKLTDETLKKVFELFVKKGLGTTLNVAGRAIHRAVPFLTNKTDLNTLSKSGSEIVGVPVTKEEIKGLDKYAKRYHFKYALVRMKNDKEQYYFSFEAKDAAKLEMAVRDFMKDQSHDRGNSDLEEKMSQAKENAYHFNKAQVHEKQQTKSHERSKSVQR